MFCSGSVHRLGLSLVLVFQLALGLVVMAPDAAQADVFKKIKKKAKKAVKKAKKATNNEISDARKDLAKTGQAVNSTNGSPSAIIFQSAGGAVTNNQGVSTSITLAFVRGGTPNVPGPAIEVSLSKLKLGFIPELQNRPPWLPTTGSLTPAYAAVALQLEGDAPEDAEEATTLAVGAAYCQALQKIK